MSKQPLIENLEHIDGTKEEIRDVLESKGIEVSDEDTFRSYADKIESLSSDANLEPFVEVTPKTVAQTIVPEEGYSAIKQVAVKAVTSDIDEDLKPENIKKDIDILGVLGTYEVKLQNSLEVEPSTESQSISPEEGFDGIKRVDVKPVTSDIDENIQSKNIKKGVNILGVEGELESSVLQYDIDIHPSTEMQYITPEDGADGVRNMNVFPVTRLIDDNIQPENILRGVEILHVVGEVDAWKLEDYKVDSPTKGHKTITPSPGYDAMRRVELSGVSSDIDENIVPENIKEGVNILGVTGVYDGVEDLELQSKTVNPTSDSRGVLVEYDEGYDALKQVYVNPIKAYMVDGLLPSIVKKGERVLELEGTYGPTSQSKVVYPSTEDQTITPDHGIEYLEQVEVLKVGPGIDSNIIPQNIREGVKILGVPGTFSGDFVFQSKRAYLTTEREIEYTADFGYTALSSVIVPPVTSSIDSDIKPENIRKGVNILGVDGSYQPAPSMEVKYISPKTYEQVIYPDDGYAAMVRVEVSPVTSSIDSNIRSSNIRDGVSILGVRGTMEPIKGENIVIEPSIDTQTFTPSEEKNAILNVTVNPVTSDIDGNINPDNIKYGVTILGVEGTFDGNITELQKKTVTPSDEEQIIIADEGYDALSRVTVEPTPTENINITPKITDQVIRRNDGVFIDTVTIERVKSDIDANIIPENIKKNMSILNVVGTYEGEPTDPIFSKLEGGQGGISHYSLGVNAWTRSVTPGIVKTIETIPSDLYVSGSTAESLFEGLSALKKVPALDFTNVTSLRRCFLGCKSLKSISGIKTDNVTDIYGAFAESGLTEFPDLNFTNVTEASYAFQRLTNTLPFIPSNLNERFPKLTNAASMFADTYFNQFVTTIGSSQVSSLNFSNNLTSISGPIELTIDSCPVNLSGKISSKHVIINYQNGGYISNLNSAFNKNYARKEDIFRINSDNNFTFNIPGCTDISSMFNYFGPASSSYGNIPKITVYAPDAVSASSMFIGCYYIDEVEIHVSDKLKNASSMFATNYIKRISLIEAGGITNCENIIFNASHLERFPGFKDLGKAFTQKTQYYSYYTLNFPSTTLPEEDLISIFDNLYDLNISYNVAGGGRLYRQRIYMSKTNHKTVIDASEECTAAMNRAIAKGWDFTWR